MRDITEKNVTLRTATAEGSVFFSDGTLQLIRRGELPKGDPFGFAKAAAFLGAKQTAHLIPHCHPIPLEALDVQFELFEATEGTEAENKDIARKPDKANDSHEGSPSRNGQAGMRIVVTGKTIARTGLEMEVLTAVSVAALTVYDLLKPVDSDLMIGGMRLTEKTGGKSDRRLRVDAGTTASVLVVSDSTAAGRREDRAGRSVRDLLEKLGVQVVHYSIVADDTQEIRTAVKRWVDEDIHFIFCAGGTGFGPQDITVEALRPILEKEGPGIAETMRRYGMDRTPVAMLSRSLAGSIGHSAVLALPGSTAGATESVHAVLPALFHMRRMLVGGGHE